MKAPLTRNVILIVASVLSAIILAGCGTVRGIGNDVENVGEGIEKSTR